MVTVQNPRHLLAAGLLLVLCIALAALQPLAARAGSVHSPTISVSDETWGPYNPHVSVQGVNFTVNSPVLVEAVTATGIVAAQAVTIAHESLDPAFLRKGHFTVVLTVSASYRGQLLRFVAVDEARGLHSNTITVRLPIVPIVKCKPYTCI